MKKGLILREGFALQNRLMVRMKYGIEEDCGGILPCCQTRRGKPRARLGNLIFNSTARKAFGKVMVFKWFAETAGRKFFVLVGLRG